MSTTRTAASPLQQAVARLSLVDEGDSVTIGNTATGTFVAVPAVGGVVLRTLADGATVDEAAAAGRAFAGEDVDVADFLAALEDAGILDYTDGAAEQRGVRWIAAVPQRVARPLFGRVTWTLYGAATVFCLVAMVAKPALRPTFDSYMYLPDPLLSMLTLYGLTLVLAVTHEAWHWLAGRALGIPARFRVSYRGVFLVAETDLSLLLTLPRKRRYGPLLAGLALNASVLAVALALRWLYFTSLLPVPDVLARLLGALVLSSIYVVVMQCAVFLRTDLYAVLACALGCENLYRVSWLTLKRRLLPLSGPEEDELRRASARDRSVARWFSLLYLVGMLGVAWFTLRFALPVTAGLVYWTIRNVSSLSAGTGVFWESLTVAVVVCAETLAPIPLAIRERRLRRAGALS